MRRTYLTFVLIVVIAAVVFAGSAAAISNSVNSRGLCLTWLAGINNMHDVGIAKETLQHFDNGSVLKCRYSPSVYSGPLPVCKAALFDPLRQTWTLNSSYVRSDGGLVCVYLYEPSG